ncbi:metalloregulator ArsR/SmtB family transcription factor [Ancylomarina sp. DW003]|nr:metalloregulator ArsR/SmtB family transcription factor [Ancylomarina sp. DW003]MDE5421026.1 metalloregulator ArsR/SmtB family transcription factor [Ancylomarina sp. DW003]
MTCIRKEADPEKISKFSNLVKDNNLNFVKVSKQLSLIGNEVRLKILWLLQQDELCVCDLSDILNMTIPAVSQHLRKLKDLEMVDFRREGKTLYYFLHPELSDLIILLLKGFANKLKTETV